MKRAITALACVIVLLAAGAALAADVMLTSVGRAPT